MKYEIQAFLLKALHNLQQNIENDYPAPYYESLTTEDPNNSRNKEILKLNKIDRTNELLDSPFSQNEKRTRRNVLDFITLLEALIKLKDGNKEALKKIFGNVSGIKILRLIKKWIANDNLETYLSLLEVISKTVLIELDDVKINQEYAHKLEDWQDSKIKLLSNSLSSQEKSQWLILQLGFLFWWNRLNDMLLEESVVNSRRINRALDDFFIPINRFTPDEENLIPSQIGLKEVILSLFESSFFNDIAKRIFYQTIPETQAISIPESIIGIIVGLSLKNLNLVRTSLLNLLGETQNKIMSGLYAILVKDPNQEKDIRALSKAIKLKGDLVLNLVDIMWNEEGKYKYNPLMKIWGDYSSTSNIISAIVAVLMEDLSWVRILSDRFKVDPHKLSVVLTWASRRQDLLRGNYDLISKELRINNEEAVETILEIAWENEEIIENLESHEEFTIEDKKLVTNVLSLDRHGRRMRRPHNRFEIPDPSYSCRIISDKLKELFGIDDDISTLKDKIKYNEQNDLKSIFTWIVDAVWGSSDAIQIIINHIESKANNSKGLIHNIWRKFPRFTSTILLKSMNKLYINAVDTISDRNLNL